MCAHGNINSEAIQLKGLTGWKMKFHYRQRWLPTTNTKKDNCSIDWVGKLRLSISFYIRIFPIVFFVCSSTQIRRLKNIHSIIICWPQPFAVEISFSNIEFVSNAIFSIIQHVIIIIHGRPKQPTRKKKKWELWKSCYEWI